MFRNRFHRRRQRYYCEFKHTTATKHTSRIRIAVLTIVPQYNPFDISVKKPGAFPYEYEAAFFNQQWVQQELGVPLNYTRGNDAFPDVFFGTTGDAARCDLSHLGNILDKGLNVALVAGDRDYRCNCEYSQRNHFL